MEVSVDSSSGLSPLPPQSYPTSPSGSRKRSIQEIDAPTSPESRKISKICDQENQDPSLSHVAASCTPTEQHPQSPSAPTASIEISNQQNVANPTAPGGSVFVTVPQPSPTAETTSKNTQPSTPTKNTNTTTPAAKKRKLSPASKEARQQEKEAKERQKLEEKAKKDEDKRIKEEERKKREAEREEERKRKEEKKRLKEEEKAAKEEDKRKKEEEKLKRERAQTKLNAFFAKPKPPTQPPEASSSDSPKIPIADGASNLTSQNRAPTLSDYQREFPDFFLQSHTRVAPPHRFERDSKALSHMQERVDACLQSYRNGSAQPLSFRPSELFRIMPYNRRRGRQAASVKEILLKMQSLNEQSDPDSARRSQELLRRIRMKSLKFGEDVRPPYQGTFTKTLPESAAHKLMRNPFHRGLPDINYDYDSEAEWEEPEEGEDLDSEEEEEGSEEGDDDMDGFLDDDEDNLEGKRRLIVGDLEPLCTGLRWQGEGGDHDLEMYRIQTITDSVTFPIDPFSTAYWQKPKPAEQLPTGGPGRSTLHSFMVVPPSTQSQTAAPTTEGVTPTLLTAGGKAKRTLTPEQLAEFKEVVNGSDLTKTGLIEVLKKRFPKVSKDVLKETLTHMATRVGQREAEKNSHLTLERSAVADDPQNRDEEQSPISSSSVAGSCAKEQVSGARAISRSRLSSWLGGRGTVHGNIMFDAQRDGLPSTLASYVTSLLPLSSQATSTCNSASRTQDSSSVSQPSAVPTPSMSPMLLIPDDGSVDRSSVSQVDLTIGESEDSGRSSSQFITTPLYSDDGHPMDQPPIPTTIPSVSTEPPRVSFEDFAIRYRQNQHKQARRKTLENRLHATKISIGISARLVRVGGVVQRGLVESLKHEDKANFLALYHALLDLQDSHDLAMRRHFHRQDPLDDWSSVQEPAVERSPDFFLQLSPQSGSDLLGILQLVRTNPQFLCERLCSLTSAQLNALLSSSATSLDSGDYTFLSASRSRSQYSLPKRTSAASVPFRDHAVNFERTDALSNLVFNVFAAPLDSDAPEARLRLDVWSSVCAELLTQGGNRFYPLIGHILSSWTMGSAWKARPKFELYLMDILQTGAFLLEHIETPAGLGFDAGSLDPLKTDVAEEYFASAVDALFNLLDDPDAGFPHAVFLFARAILQKLDHPDCRARFLEYLFLQWFFPKFLSGALAYPETHGLLLDFHIRKDAREKLLGQVALRAYSQVFAILRSMNHFSMTRPAVRQHVENMLRQFETTDPDNKQFAQPSAPRSHQESPCAFLMLSAADVLTLLGALFPTASSPTCSSPTPSSGLSTLSPSSLHYYPERRTTAVPEPGFYRRNLNGGFSRQFSSNKAFSSADMDFFTCSENRLSRNADRIRFELSALVEPDGRSGLEYPSTEEWAIFSVTQGGHRLVWGLFSEGQLSDTGNLSVDACQSTTLGMEDNFEALHTAIIKLVRENPAGDPSDYCVEREQMAPSESSSLKKRFNEAMSHCHHTSDFIGAHYWWNASRQLLRSVAGLPSRLGDDSWILEPMHTTCSRSLQVAHSVIERCETDFVALDRSLRQLQGTVKETIKTITKLRNKMWYMTDVKNSMRYEDARNVALALKTMVYSARLYQPIPTNERRTRSSSRTSGGSVLQKPELQVMNVMKAPSSQGGPNKLSDEQVELTRKWLAQNNIDNFCKGEERIHRFCYEVKVSINRLVGDTMAEAPVLWASELFQKERVKFEGSSNRSFLGLSSSSLRPVSTTCEEPSFPSQSYGGSLRSSDSLCRYTQDLPPLNRKSSFQSSISGKWRIPREPSAADGLSIGDSPSKAASTSTGDTYSTFWSVPHQNAPYAASASSFYSRPPSMLSEGVAQPARQKDCKGQGKVTFLDELKQALTSLLLSDLGSPVWSCGSETDAWFGNALDQERIRVQMKKREKIQRFYAECNARTVRQTISCSQSRGRRSRSLGPPVSGRAPESDETSSGPMFESAQAAEDQSPFSYGAVFRQLIEIFSRHGNPFVKLNALRDLRALVIASLNLDNDDKTYAHADQEHAHSRERGLHGKRAARYSFSESRTLRKAEKDFLQTPTSPAAESVTFDSRPSEYSAPTENQIVDALRSLLLEVKPKTLFRDLQFISAFVPSETLNKTDSGTAFLQFGLAALSLKEEVCNSMVEIADRIVSQELSRRHQPPPFGFDARPSHAIEDAAGMWIITAKEGNPVAQRELAILYLTHPELLPRVTLPLTSPRDTFKAEMMYRRDKDSKSDPQSMCLALHWMQLSANGGDQLARNRLREREEFDSIA
ncbi:uncharacterized protein CDV56_107677 [Aspergillus thermomutatus]|uniref:Chromatin assembly factor 1 subunit A n=1 Tax=Aspergillus thermomutatus TaxID=41047 RepID=A0A397H4V0_ASPTH|nr:uncharacterized protein CDV56_107677 [Aspergillus thermomutatus]RHZ56694.1 hypothetical protein CDV56_107677 [Aspergillus thermomutatus]